MSVRPGAAAGTRSTAPGRAVSQASKPSAGARDCGAQ